MVWIMTILNITLYNERTEPELYYPEHCTLYRIMYRTRYRVQTIILVLFTEHTGNIRHRQTVGCGLSTDEWMTGNNIVKSLRF